MKRPRTKVAEAIAIRAYHAQMKWLHEMSSNKRPWENNQNFVRWVIGKTVDKPK